jgi:hypothetical protein
VIATLIDLPKVGEPLCRAAVVAAILASLPGVAEATDVRVRNESRYTLANVVVGSKRYGGIRPGESSAYQAWQRAYRHSRVSLLANGKVQKLTPFDHVGEAFLCSGQMTYVLSFKAGKLDIRAEVDSEPPGTWALDETHCR